MSGNVWEWVWDWLGPYPDMYEKDPMGPDAGEYRVVRGGRWGLSSEYVRSVSRARGFPDHPLRGSLGFRLVRPLGP